MKQQSSHQAWVGVVSRAHVQRGVGGGFAKLCHGREAPLRRMQAGDWLVYYSPTSEFRSGDPIRAFTAIGRVADAQLTRCDMGDGFVPWRRDVHYLAAESVPIDSLRDQLQFIRDNPNWGWLARRGHFEIGLPDLQVIAKAMGIRAGRSMD
jgi:hypothetical protein